MAYVTMFDFSKKRVYDADALASKAVPLIGEAATQAGVKFVKMAQAIDSDVTRAMDVAVVYEYFVPYLGTSDACMIAAFLGTGRKWSNRSFGDPAGLSAEEYCGTLKMYTIADRRVEDAEDHAGVVFKNVPLVTNYIKSHGGLKEAKVLAADSAIVKAKQAELLKAAGEAMEAPFEAMKHLDKLLMAGAALLVLYGVWKVIGLSKKVSKMKLPKLPSPPKGTVL